MDRMFNFMRKRNLRVIDLFNTFGRNGRWHITKQDIRTAFRVSTWGGIESVCLQCLKFESCHGSVSV